MRASYISYKVIQRGLDKMQHSAHCTALFTCRLSASSMKLGQIADDYMQT